MPGSETAALRQSEGQSTRINSQLVSSDANRIAGPAPAGYNGDSVSRAGLRGRLRAVGRRCVVRGRSVIRRRNIGTIGSGRAGCSPTAT